MRIFLFLLSFVGKCYIIILTIVRLTAVWRARAVYRTRAAAACVSAATGTMKYAIGQVTIWQPNNVYARVCEQVNGAATTYAYKISCASRYYNIYVQICIHILVYDYLLYVYRCDPRRINIYINNNKPCACRTYYFLVRT